MLGLLMVAVFVAWHESLIIVLRNKLTVFMNLPVRYLVEGELGEVGTAVVTGVAMYFLGALR